MGVTIVDRQNCYPCDRQRLAAAVDLVLKLLGVADLALEITVVDDPEISRINARYFGRQRPTNVISFPQDQEHGLLGDVVVSVETVARETSSRGYILEEGLLYYIIHAILHLLQYEHVGVSPAIADGMYRKQEELFEQVLREI